VVRIPAAGDARRCAHRVRTAGWQQCCWARGASRATARGGATCCSALAVLWWLTALLWIAFAPPARCAPGRPGAAGVLWRWCPRGSPWCDCGSRCRTAHNGAVRTLLPGVGRRTSVHSSCGRRFGLSIRLSAEWFGCIPREDMWRSGWESDRSGERGGRDLGQPVVQRAPGGGFLPLCLAAVGFSIIGRPDRESC